MLKSDNVLSKSDKKKAKKLRYFAQYHNSYVKKLGFDYDKLSINNILADK